MSTLDKFIQDHAELFDDQEPEEGHLERFQARLDRFHEPRLRPAPVRLWMRVAAGVLILVTAGLAIFELATRDFSGQTPLQRAAVGVPDDILEVISIYQIREDQNLAELGRITRNCPDGALRVSRVRNEIACLDRNMEDLLTAIRKNPSDNRVQAALIQTCKAKESLLNDVILGEKMKKCE